jgi:hypothetical protein
MNAPLGLHYAQELLGITKTEPSVGMFQTYYLDSLGQSQLFTKWDVGGCSRGGYKMLGHLLVENAMTLGHVGNAQTALIDAQKSTSIAQIALSADCRSFVCDDSGCLSCRGRWRVSGFMTPVFFFKNLVQRRPTKSP